MVGYLIGNYNLLLHFGETAAGLIEYNRLDAVSFISYLFGKNHVIWDHICDLPFNFSIMPVITAVTILFVCPVVFHRYRYLPISIFITANFYYFIQKIATGQPWHGFGVGLFIVTFAAFILSDVQKEEIHNWKKGLVEIAAVIQLLNCFAYYIPIQAKWHSITEEAIDVLINKEEEIYDAVTTLIMETDDAPFMIDLAVKRYQPVAVSVPRWTKVNLRNTYYAAQNYAFLDPLAATNYYGWSRLYSSSPPGDRQYVIWIIPNCFMRMGDVASIHPYDKYSITDMIHGDGYTVYLYSVV